MERPLSLTVNTVEVREKQEGLRTRCYPQRPTPSDLLLASPPLLKFHLTGKLFKIAQAQLLPHCLLWTQGGHPHFLINFAKAENIYRALSPWPLGNSSQLPIFRQELHSRACDKQKAQDECPRSPLDTPSAEAHSMLFT